MKYILNSFVTTIPRRVFELEIESTLAHYSQQAIHSSLFNGKNIFDIMKFNLKI